MDSDALWSSEFVESLGRLAETIEKLQSFVVTTHVFPDGDAIGSQVALHEFLLGLGKESVMINGSSTPEKYRFLDPDGEILIMGRTASAPSARIASAMASAQAVIVVDCAFLRRTGPVFRLLEAFQGPIVSVDHHEIRAFEPRVNIALVDHGASACGEMILELIHSMGGKPGPRGIDSLYTALLTDTARFTGPTVDARVFRMAAGLVDGGASPNYIYQQIYESYSLDHYRLFSVGFDSMRILGDRQGAVMTLTRKMFRDHGIKPFEVEFFIDLICSIKGLRLIAVAREMEKHSFAVSLRSRSDVSVGKIAEAFGGGGHRDMAGMSLSGSAEEIEEILATALCENMGIGVIKSGTQPSESGFRLQ